MKTIPEAKMEDIEMMAEGCVVDGKYVQPVGIAKDSDFLRIVVSDGRKREVKFPSQPCAIINKRSLGPNLCRICRIEGKVA